MKTVSESVDIDNHHPDRAASLVAEAISRLTNGSHDVFSIQTIPVRRYDYAHNMGDAENARGSVLVIVVFRDTPVPNERQLLKE